MMSPQQEHPIDAVIFLPAMDENAIAQPVSGIATRIARALDFHDKEERAQYVTEPIASLEYGGKHPRDAEGCRVTRLADGATQPMYDVYKVDYRPALYTGAHMHGLRANLSLALGILRFIGRWIIALFPSRSGGAQSFRKRVQVLIGGLLIFCACIVLMSTAVAALSTVPLALDKIGTLANFTPGFVGEGMKDFIQEMCTVLVALCGVGLFLPVNTRSELDALVRKMHALGIYIESDHHREKVQAEVRNAIEAIAESPRGYTTITLIGYSFGSLVALDATILNPSPDSRTTKYVRYLVTIGCPASFVNTYWNGFFSPPRGSSRQSDAFWINVFSPEDVLGSELKVKIGDEDISPADEFPYPEPLNRGFKGSITRAFESHIMYWEPGCPDHPAAFSVVMRALQKAKEERGTNNG